MQPHTAQVAQYENDRWGGRKIRSNEEESGSWTWKMGSDISNLLSRILCPITTWFALLSSYSTNLTNYFRAWPKCCCINRGRWFPQRPIAKSSLVQARAHMRWHRARCIPKRSFEVSNNRTRPVDPCFFSWSSRISMLGTSRISWSQSTFFGVRWSYGFHNESVSQNEFP